MKVFKVSFKIQENVSYFNVLVSRWQLVISNTASEAVELIESRFQNISEITVKEN